MTHTQSVQGTQSLDLARHLGLRVLDSVALVEDTIKPPSGLEPAVV